MWQSWGNSPESWTCENQKYINQRWDGGDATSLRYVGKVNWIVGTISLSGHFYCYGISW